MSCRTSVKLSCVCRVIFVSRLVSCRIYAVSYLCVSVVWYMYCVVCVMFGLWRACVVFVMCLCRLVFVSTRGRERVGESAKPNISQQVLVCYIKK